MNEAKAAQHRLLPDSFLPPETPLAMPEQSLWRKIEGSGERPTSPRHIFLRRAFVFVSTIAMTIVAANEMYQVLQVAGLTVLEMVILALFIMLFAWIAFSFVSTLVGFFATITRCDRPLGIDPASPLPVLKSRNALLLPTYNEPPHRVFSRLQAICESVAETGQLEKFEFFVLSDTTDPDIWIVEEAAYLSLIQEIGPGRVFYRHRKKNTARKSGNISEWVTRFGGRYDHMIVLDADSLMAGDSIVRLADAMERHPNVGIIQTFPVLVNGRTLFARLQQFAGRIYGPLIARGVAWWHGSESNYWGHNAIIRVKAFADQAGLPLLGGPKPLGGHILSHDFVEAALMRRAGWGVHLAPGFMGSFEECPPSLTDYAVRDRRWCQGNIQHLGVLPARGLHWVSRLHLLTGIGSYITSPLWLLFLLVGIFISLQAQFIRPEYFSERSLFPQWPAQDPVRARWVFFGTMAILLVPKVLGYLVLLRSPPERRSCGGALRAFVSVMVETLISGLIAPVMMLLQSRSILEIAMGRDSGWQPQRRDGGKLSVREYVRAYLWPTGLGLLLAACAYAVSFSLFLWMTPVVIGLLLAIPLAIWTASPRAGACVGSLGLLLTPEDTKPPKVLRRAGVLELSSGYRAPVEAITLLRTDAAVLMAHMAVVSENPVRPRGEYDVDRLVGIAKVEDSSNLEEAIELLTPREKYAVLNDGMVLKALLSKACS